MNKLRLWLLAHGVEFKVTDRVIGTPTKHNRRNISRTIFMVVNHRYFGLDILINPFRGVYADELNTPHAEIAAQYKQDAER